MGKSWWGGSSRGYGRGGLTQNKKNPLRNKAGGEGGKVAGPSLTKCKKSNRGEDSAGRPVVLRRHPEANIKTNGGKGRCPRKTVKLGEWGITEPPDSKGSQAVRSFGEQGTGGHENNLKRREDNG